MAKSALVALGGPPNGTKRRIYDARCGRAASVPEHMGMCLERQFGNLASSLDHSYWTPMPPRREPPPKHNPPTQHVPPWLSEHQKRRHMELALEYEYSVGLRERPSRARKPPKLSSRQRREAAMKQIRK
jgi:hypothetical protein